MALPSAYAQYNNSRIMTAKPADLTLMLYEGAIKFCNIAIDGCREKNIEKAFGGVLGKNRGLSPPRREGVL